MDGSFRRKRSKYLEHICYRPDDLVLTYPAVSKHWREGRNQFLLYTWWRGGATVGRWTCDQEVVGSIPGSGRSYVTTVGKSLTPACPAPLKLRRYGAIQISILYYYYVFQKLPPESDCLLLYFPQTPPECLHCSPNLPAGRFAVWKGRGWNARRKQRPG